MNDEQRGKSKEERWHSDQQGLQPYTQQPAEGQFMQPYGQQPPQPREPQFQQSQQYQQPYPPNPYDRQPVPRFPQEEQYQAEQAYIAEEESNRRGIWSTPGTLLIVAINIAVYLAMGAVSNGVAMFSPTFANLRFFGGNIGALTFAGEPWRLLTCCFVHSGLVHIGMNMYILWDIGRAVENIYGTSKYLYAYLLAGIGGALTSLYFHNNIISVGASGAVFGTFGAFLGFFLAHRSAFPKEVVQSATRSVMLYLLGNLLIGFSLPGIDNAAHIGGFVFGLLAGLAVVPRTVYERGWKPKDIVFALVLIGLLFGIFNYEDAAFNRSNPL